jgi:hypothetical protein
MSADNGIYILQTPAIGGGFEYRVTEAGAIDNITYENENGNPEQVVSYFGKCKVFTDHTEAWQEAARLEPQYDILEYGVSSIGLPFPFEHYVKAAGDVLQEYIVTMVVNLSVRAISPDDAKIVAAHEMLHAGGGVVEYKEVK